MKEVDHFIMNHIEPSLVADEQAILGRERTVVARLSRGPRLKMLTLSLLILVGILITSVGLMAATPTSPRDKSASVLIHFRCPEEYTSNEDKQSALRQIIRAYTHEFPNNDVRDMMLFRYRLLVTHSCIQTLNTMLMNVSPVSEMLRVQNQNFGPKTEEFDRKTRVWTVYFRKDGEPPELSDEDLIFNFYGWKPATSPEAIAEAFVSPRENLHILRKFEAPDNLTKAPAYFIVSETIYPVGTYAYLNISKISSVGSGAYTVTLAKKITGESTTNINEKCKSWLIGKASVAAIRLVSNVGVNSAWEQHFAQARK